MTFKILVVDDEPESIDFIVSILEDNGYDYITAVDGEEGLRQAGIEKPDLILLDLIMPEKSGILMFQELKKDPETRDIPVIVVSGASRITGVDFGDFKVKQEFPEGGEGRRQGGQNQIRGPRRLLGKAHLSGQAAENYQGSAQGIETACKTSPPVFNAPVPMLCAACPEPRSMGQGPGPWTRG